MFEHLRVSLTTSTKMKNWYSNVFVGLSAILVLLVLSASCHPLDEDTPDVVDAKMSDYMANILDMMNYAKNSQNSQSNVFDRFQEVNKRERRPYRSRSGGMSLCLWKVCPAAPWLIRRNWAGWETHDVTSAGSQKLATREGRDTVNLK